jgi:hypothetical protein
LCFVIFLGVIYSVPTPHFNENFSSIYLLFTKISIRNLYLFKSLGISVRKFSLHRSVLSIWVKESWFFFTNIDSLKPILWWWPSGFILGVKIKNECLVANFPDFLGRTVNFLLKNLRKVDHILSQALVLGQFFKYFWAWQTCHELMLHLFGRPLFPLCCCDCS